MKSKILLSIIVVFLAFVAEAQQQGVITYESKLNMHRRIPPERAEMKSMIPEFRVTTEQLFFNEKESQYKTLVEDEEQDVNASQGGARMRFRMPKSDIYMNQETQMIMAKAEFSGKEYLIVDSIKIAPWKMGTETREIKGYVCQMAYYDDEETKTAVTAWFTMQIQPFLGPERYNTLPGTVLALDINNGERVFVVNKIEMRELKKNELKAPTTGEKITQAQYRAMVQERMKQMGGQGGQMIIRN